MNSLKPYLIRAIYDWIVDNSFTPYLLVNAEGDGVIVPRQYVKDGKIVLNLRPQAVQGLVLGNRNIAFSARFGGNPMQVDIPIRAVLAIYAQENGKGMIFDENEEDDTPPSGDSPSKEPASNKRPSLRVVK
jgi:stringent starvation protein B